MSEPAEDQLARRYSLSRIALLVLDIVKRKESTTLTEVADQILKDIVPDKDSAGAESTIRRRVYDVLNVLEAAGFVSKENRQKSIQYSEPVHFRAENRRLIELDSRVKAKTAALADKIQAYLHWKMLIRRNREMTRPDDAIPIEKTIFVGYRDFEKKNVHLRGKNVALESACEPLFFAPCHVMQRLDFSREEQRKIMEDEERMRPLLNVMFPDSDHED